MSDTTPHQTQIYLITPGRIAIDSFPDLLCELLDTGLIAAVRLEIESRDQDTVSRSADALRGICHARDLPLILTDHYRMVKRLGLDGVHLKGTRDVRDARAELGENATVGTFCGTSRHAAMTAGEIGADYVSFGPVTQTELGSGEIADLGAFSWWHQMIEVPSVAEGNLTPEAAKTLAPCADFIALGPEIWTGSPKQTLTSFAAAIGLT